MEKEENLKLRLVPESGSGDYVFSFDKTLPLRDQVIDAEKDFYLLNVRKVFTNNVYYGVSYSVLDNQNNILHHFKCKDSSRLSEVEIDNKETFMNFYRSWEKVRNSLQDRNITLIKQDFDLPYEVYFCYKQNNLYFYTIIDYDSDNTFRGLYGSESEESYKRAIRDTSKVWFYNSVPTEKQVFDFVEEKKLSLSNVMHTVSTEYSSIIIEHITQYNSIISDIKRRQNVKKSTNDE